MLKNNQIVYSILRLRRRLFYSSAFPKNIDSFKEIIKQIEAEKYDEIQRSFKAYSIKNNYSDANLLKKILRRALYTILFPVSYFFWQFPRNYKKDITVKSDIVYFKISNNMSIMPLKYVEMSEMAIEPNGGGHIVDDDVKSILAKCAKLGRGDFEFLFMVMFSLSNYCYIIKKYKPKEIITTYESSPIVSILTLYCHMNGVKHTNFMHGEKILSHVNTLGCFDDMYVWEDHYKLLFNDLKYKCINYYVYNPWRNIELPKASEYFDYVFYLNYETKSTMNRIAAAVNKIKAQGKSVKVRFHPSQVKDYSLRKIVDEADIEDNRKVSILQSISNCNYAVSRYSTVLFQAYSFGKKIVIDDYSYPKEYESLLKLDYYMIGKEDLLLSEII